MSKMRFISGVFLLAFHLVMARIVKNEGNLKQHFSEIIRNRKHF